MEKEKILEVLKHGTELDKIEAIECLKNFPEEDVVELLLEIIEKERQPIRQAAFSTLLTFPDKARIAKDAVKFLKSSDPLIKAEAVEFLSSLGSDVVPYLESFISSHDPNERKLALDVLGPMKIKEAVPFILHLTRDENPNVKYSAVEYLVSFPDDVHVKNRLCELIKETENLYGIIAVTFVIKSFGDSYFKIPLLEKLKDTKDPLQKQQIYKALISVWDGEPERSLLEEALNNAKEIGGTEDLFKEITLRLGRLPKYLSGYMNKRRMR